jgi:hypothetical protein
VPTTDATPCPNPYTGAPTPVAPRPSERRHFATPLPDAGAVGLPMPRASDCTGPKERGGKPVTLLTATRSHHWLRSMVAATTRQALGSEASAAQRDGNAARPHRTRDRFFLGDRRGPLAQSRFYLRKGIGDVRLHRSPGIRGLSPGARGPEIEVGRADGDGRPERGSAVRGPAASGARGAGGPPIRGADGR